MRNVIYCFLLSLYIIFSSGCMEPGISWTWDEYVKSDKKNTPIHRWNKAGASEEQKTKDWIECCGRADGNFPGCELIKLPEETTVNQAYDRLQKNLVKCMTKKGYKFMIL